MKGEILKGHLDLLLLSVVQAGVDHGYAIAEELRRASTGAFDLPEGTIYPALHRLEAGGFLESRWQPVAGRPRRVYNLSPLGRAELARQRELWERFVAGVNAVIGRAACGDTA